MESDKQSSHLDQALEQPVQERIADLLAINTQLGQRIGELERELDKRQQAEAALRKSEARWLLAIQASEAHYRAIVEDQTELICRYKPEGTLTFVNDAYCRYFDKQPEELIGHGFMPLIPEEDWIQIENLITSLSRDHPVGTIEHRIIRPNGEIRWQQWSDRVIFDQQGRLVEYQSVGRDITERKRAEIELQRQYQRSQLLAEVTQKIRQSLQLTEILQTAVAEVQNLFQADRVLIVQLHSDESGSVVEEAVLPDWPSMLGQTIPRFGFHPDYLAQYRQGIICAIADLNQSILEPFDAELQRQYAIKAALVTPVLVQSQLWGLLIAQQCKTPRQWDDFEIELSQQLSDQIGLAISQSQLLGNLEMLVAERTAELTTANQQLQQEINDRKRAETALRQSEEQLRLTTDALPVLIAYVDNQQRYRFINRAYEDWYGKSLADIQGRCIRDLVGDAFYEKIQAHIETALSGQKVTYEIQSDHQDGRLRDVNVTYIPHVGENQDVKGVFTLVSDISDRKAIERMKDEFVSVISHELRTPLTSIHGSLKLLATGRLGALSNEGQQMLEIADENTDRLVRLVNDVLDLQRIESGKVAMDKRVCNASDLMMQATEGMQGMAQQHEISLSTTPVSIALMADPDSIVQTLTNLLSNAIKFSQPGGMVWLTAELGTKAIAPRAINPKFKIPPPHPLPPTSYIHPTPYITFQVKDQGQGIPTSKLESIFERFHQVDTSDSRNKGGTGLGLAICRRIVEQHGGRIWAESTIGEGSSFYFTLPAASKE